MATADNPKDATGPFSAFEWLIALRYLRSRRKETFISVIAGFSFAGIMLGVATLIVVMAVMNGFRSELLDKILGVNGHVILQPIERPFDDFAAVSEGVGRVDGVTAVIPFVEGQALATGPSGAQGAIVRGMTEGSLRAMPLVAPSVRAGSLDGFDLGTRIAIGTRLAAALGLSVGDRLTLVAPRGTVTPFGVTPRVKAYEVGAIFEIGMSEYDLVFVYMPLAEAQAFFNQAGIVSAIDVYVEDPDSVSRYRRTIEDAANRPVFTVDWRQHNTTFFSALEVEKNVMFLILFMIVLVAALNVVSGLTMLVKDKGRDIAVLRTMGVGRPSVMRIFVITGASIGVAGTLFGFLLGTILCLNVENIRLFISSLTRTELFSPELYYLSRLPAEMDPGETFFVVIMALILSLAATIGPAWRASRLDPVEALRYE